MQEVFVKSLAVVDLRVWRSDVGGALRRSTAAVGIHARFHAVALALQKAHNCTTLSAQGRMMILASRRSLAGLGDSSSTYDHMSL